MNHPYALITGSGRGIGFALAEELASRGHAIAMVSLPGEDLADSAQKLKARYRVDVIYLELDLSGENAPEAVFDWFVSHAVRCDILINNAGFGTLGRFMDTSLDVHRRLMHVNMIACASLTQLFIPLLKKENRSWIMNTSSTAGLMPVPYKTAYSASKSFVFYFSRALRTELKDDGISVSVLCPGGTYTSPAVNERIHQAGFLSRWSALYPEEVARIAIKRMYQGRPRIIPGNLNSLMVWFATTIPYFLTAAAFRKQFSKA